MGRSRLVVCSLGVVLLLGTVISFAANPPSKLAGGKKAEAEKQAVDADADNPFGGSSPGPAQKSKKQAAIADALDPFGGSAPEPAKKAVKKAANADALDPFGGSSHQPVKKPAKQAEPPAFHTGRVAIEAVLERSTQVEFVETPLKDVVEYVKDLHHVEIYLDSSALRDAGVDGCTQVTCNLRGLSLEKTLNIILDEIQLSWTIHNDVLYITTPARLKSEDLLDTRVYDVADLVVYQDEKGKPWDDFSSLSDMITGTIESATWQDSGGAGTIRGDSLGTAKVLAVTQSYPVHKKIEALLAEIRAMAAKHSGGGLPTRERPKAAEGWRGCALRDATTTPATAKSTKASGDSSAATTTTPPATK